MDGVLSLPFGSGGIVGNDGVDAICKRELRVANLLPAAIGPPELHRSNGVEVAAEVVGRVHVDPCHAFCASATTGYDGAVVAAVLLQYEVADLNGGVILAATEVEHQFHVVDVHTRHVALEEHIILTSLQVYTVGEEVDFIVVVLSQLDGSASEVLVGVQDDGEVVVGDVVGSHIGAEGHLRLPLLGVGQRQVDGPAVVALNECRIRTLTPVLVSIPEGNVVLGSLEHVAIAVGIEAALFSVTLVGSAGEDEAPGDAAIGSLIDEHELCSRERLNAEQRVRVLIVAADVGECGVGSQLDVLLCGHLTVSILPLQLFERPS